LLSYARHRHNGKYTLMRTSILVASAALLLAACAGTPTQQSTGEQIDERLGAGVDIVSATYVTPYPPGFPVLVPGQVFSREILQFMRDLDTKEIHGYEPNFGYRVYTEKAIEMVGAAAGLPCGCCITTPRR